VCAGHDVTAATPLDGQSRAWSPVPLVSDGGLSDKSSRGHRPSRVSWRHPPRRHHTSTQAQYMPWASGRLHTRGYARPARAEVVSARATPRTWDGPGLGSPDHGVAMRRAVLHRADVSRGQAREPRQGMTSVGAHTSSTPGARRPHPDGPWPSPSGDQGGPPTPPSSAQRRAANSAKQPLWDSIP
jgi:hypothetical protein